MALLTPSLFLNLSIKLSWRWTAAILKKKKISNIRKRRYWWKTGFISAHNNRCMWGRSVYSRHTNWPLCKLIDVRKTRSTYVGFVFVPLAALLSTLPDLTTIGQRRLLNNMIMHQLWARQGTACCPWQNRGGETWLLVMINSAIALLAAAFNTDLCQNHFLSCSIRVLSGILRSHFGLGSDN